MGLVIIVPSISPQEVQVDAILAHLTDCLKEFCREQKLPYMSADDLLMTHGTKMTDYQYQWMFHFIRVWEYSELLTTTKEKTA